MDEVNEQEKIKAAYDKGVLDQRLNAFDNHFTSINGSVERTASELSRLRNLIEEQLSSLNLRLVQLDQMVVKREGPIADRVETNSQRLDKLEAGQPAVILQLKKDVNDDLQTLRDSLLESRFAGSYRRFAAAGSAFGIALGGVIAAARGLGFV